MTSLSFTRPLSLCSHWRCLSATVTGSHRAALSFMQSLPPGQENYRQILVPRHIDGTFMQHFHSQGRAPVERQLKTDVEDSYDMLGVDEDCDDQALKEAYLQKAKAYHPDSASLTSDPHKFSQLKDAYKTVLEHRKAKELELEQSEDEEEAHEDSKFDTKYKAPQHRQYLEFEGVGHGTPSQRQRQYQRHRVARVTENIFQYRMERHAMDTEDALVVKDKKKARKVKISNAIEMMVEDLIQEAMKRGDFDNLPGQGRPLTYSAHNPFLDATTHNLNKILTNNGFAPEWIMLQSEIRRDMQRARQALALAHSRLEQPPSATLPSKTLEESVSKFRQQVDEINGQINKFNLIVPILTRQLVPYSAEREMRKVAENVEKYLPGETDIYWVWEAAGEGTPSAGSNQGKSIDWRQVWKDIKTVFTSSKRQK